MDDEVSGQSLLRKQHLLDRYQTLFLQQRNDRLRVALAQVKNIVPGVVGDQLSYGLVLTGTVALVARGSLSIGYYAAFLGAAERFRDASLLLLVGIRGIDSDLRYLKDMFDYLDLEEEERIGEPRRARCGSRRDSTTSANHGVFAVPPVLRSLNPGDSRAFPLCVSNPLRSPIPGRITGC